MFDYEYLHNVCDTYDDENDEFKNNLYHIAADALNESSDILKSARREIKFILSKKE